MADREWRLAYPMPDVDEPATRRGLRPCMFCERAAVYEADDVANPDDVMRWFDDAVMLIGEDVHIKTVAGEWRVLGEDNE